jgi:energy-converting hydrogenase Eha subunit E
MSVEIVAIIQGAYYFISGVWPLLHMGSFMKVTGPKTDKWLVKTVAILLAVIAISLLIDAFRGDIRSSTFFLAIGSAFGLSLIEIVYVGKKVISPIYLADTAAEAVLILLWLFFLFAT